MQKTEQPSKSETKSALMARLEDADIDIGNPFNEDLLKRKPYAEILTKVLSIYTHGAVIALNGKWGTGKTTFVKKWQAMLELEQYGFTTIYFNAWQSDYVDDPLIPLIANLKKQEGKNAEQDEKFSEVMNSALKIILNVGIGLGKGLVKTVAGGFFSPVVDGVTDEIKKNFSKQLDESAKQSFNMEVFKKALKEYVRCLNSDKPLIYFVDELDRCNPTFAVKVLERIKHLFEIEDIIFILSIDKEQLENSIKGYFGSGIDAEEYLRRFIDISYNLPQPELRDFCGHLYDYYNLQSFFQNKKRKSLFRDEDILFLNTAAYICTFKQISLRQLDRIFALTAITLKEFEPDQLLFPDLFFFLIYLKICFPLLFERISYKKLSIQELIQEIENNTPTQMVSDVFSTKSYNAQDYNCTVAKLLVTYANDEFSNDVQLVIKESDDCLGLSFPVSKLSSIHLIQDIKSFSESFQGGNYPIKNLTDKINLFGSIMN